MTNYDAAVYSLPMDGVRAVGRGRAPDGAEAIRATAVSERAAAVLAARQPYWRGYPVVYTPADRPGSPR